MQSDMGAIHTLLLIWPFGSFVFLYIQVENTVHSTSGYSLTRKTCLPLVLSPPIHYNGK